MKIEELSIQLFADGADKKSMLQLYRNPLIKGFTTNPTLMCKAGISDYRTFGLTLLAAIPDKPISFEVFSDDLLEMREQALIISRWGKHVYVKIPICNTLGETTLTLIAELAKKNIKQNITAITTLEQVKQVSDALGGVTPAFISVFAGRIADTGIDPVPIMNQAVKYLQKNCNQSLIWASPRELLNIVQAAQVSCPIITLTNDLLNKLNWLGRDLKTVSLDTVKMFRKDAIEAGLVIREEDLVSTH